MPSSVVEDDQTFPGDDEEEKEEEEEYSNTAALFPPHPLGIRPAGNAYTSKLNLRSATGFFCRLTDELVNEVLEYLDADSLNRTGCTCKALYAFSRSEDLWKALFLKSNSTSPKIWLGKWRNTYLGLPASHSSNISCQHLFSDLLYRPYQCSHLNLTSYTRGIPATNAIPRLSHLSASTFASAEWVNTPFILTDVVKAWPAYKTWSLPSLLERYGETSFRAESVDWPLRVYAQYMAHNDDESPLYLFDRAFVEKMGLSVGNHGDYWAPECFGQDRFEVLGRDRPDCRWLIVGPERSGSTFHKDPNATSAWNAVLRGRKYWIMFPSSDPPPGVYVSADQSEVTSPLSIAEWLLGFHAKARRRKGCLEGICNEGEVLHVPSGWWHLVVNLSPAIAITQNFVPRAHLPAALLFLRDQPDSVTGFSGDVKDPYQLFVQRLREHDPEVLEEALGRMSTMSAGKKRKWDELVKGDGGGDEVNGNGNGGLFSFGFAADGDNDDEDEVEVP
ncbi:MAG: hypothetical protein M1816_002106 [Peltula sp. TS41687]|nr:MAG: hypothetical protein M1816_002106 [Peltula sp. TS41687]